MSTHAPPPERIMFLKPNTAASKLGMSTITLRRYGGWLHRLVLTPRTNLIPQRYILGLLGAAPRGAANRHVQEWFSTFAATDRAAELVTRSEELFAQWTTRYISDG